jgi:hypothetical protein
MTLTIGHTQIHAPIPGFEPVATCCARVAGGGACGWHTEDHAEARNAVTHPEDRRVTREGTVDQRRARGRTGAAS